MAYTTSRIQDSHYNTHREREREFLSNFYCKNQTLIIFKTSDLLRLMEKTIDKRPNLEGESEFNSLIYTELTIHVLSFGNLKPSSLLKVLLLSRILLT